MSNFFPILILTKNQPFLIAWHTSVKDRYKSSLYEVTTTQIYVLNQVSFKTWEGKSSAHRHKVLSALERESNPQNFFIWQGLDKVGVPP